MDSLGLRIDRSKWPELTVVADLWFLFFMVSGDTNRNYFWLKFGLDEPQSDICIHVKKVAGLGLTYLLLALLPLLFLHLLLK